MLPIMLRINKNRVIYPMQIIQSIQNRIYEIRGERVMLDFENLLDEKHPRENGMRE
jgi:hypothetical protein